MSTDDFYRAITNNDIETMSKMLAEGFNININKDSDYFISALKCAIFSNALKSVKFLIEAGADVSWRVSYTPLRDALLYGTL